MIQEDQGQCSSQTINNFETYQEQFLLQQQIMRQQQNTFSFPSSADHQVSPIFQQPWSMQQLHHHNHHVHDPFVIPQQQTSSSPYASLFNRSTRVPSLQFAYDHHHHGSEHLRIISDTLQHGSGVPFGGLHQSELGKMSAQEIMEAKALAASKSHSEAERRRRERINNHLAKLRSLLPSTTKTDKASLLAEVIQHVKELKRQTSLIAETSPVPTECDELTVDAATDDDEEYGSNYGNKFIIKASLCCDDRSDLLPELIKTLKALRLRTLKADITTLGGRVKNVLFITGEEEDHEYCISSIQEALKAVMEKSVGDDSASGSVKRQRTNIISISN
ncbi:transcription factor bHLH30-like protein [Trifolium pratense]|uniref:Transcription factor bHLH30-like protein n=2 Tax=Trifolium pratense TaxID=57577 RepID=A0A2K3P0A0_TRIPR|nr:transcription factor bHLH30 [Trifolium pratense]PNY08726.1 transcription factor bHLH30-like protein [Trifolium pratense]CAJ2629511.1 unnamed protein product [Trifolium pratense]